MRQTSQRRAAILQALTEHGNGAGQRTGRANGRFCGDHPQRPQCSGITGTGAAQPRRRAPEPPPPEQTIPQKDALNHEQKERIGACAARMVQPGDNIIIDSGTTTISLARHLRDAENVTVLTNGLNIAWELARRRAWT
jgi:DeoR family transcriptional regulator of aga operon